MSTAQVYIVVAIVVLAIVAILAFLVGKRGRGYRLTPLTGLAFAFIVAGMVFGEERLLGYGLMGAGVILAVVDAVVKWKGK